LSLIRRRGQIKASIHILDWLESIIVWPVLLYRRVRYGYAFRRIRLAQPRYAKVDPADYKRLKRYEWIAQKGTCNFYAVRQVRGCKGKRVTLIYLHKEIIKVPDGMVIDHINYDGMDNRCANLRAATYPQNMYHRRKRSGAKHSKYKGVCWKKDRRKWLARIAYEKKKIHLGCFRSEIDAAKAYDHAAKIYHGEFASLNFPQSPGG
jgi:hypothetical protein